MAALNTKQRIVVLIGIAIIAGMLLVPPWKRYGGGGSAGYGLLFDSAYRFDVGRSLERGRIQFSGGENVYLDMSRLFVQCALIVVVVGGMVFVLGGRK